MLTVFYHFSDSVSKSDSVELWKQNMADGEILTFPFKSGTKPPANGAVLLSDIQETLSAWSLAGGCAIGWEHDGLRLQVAEVVSGIEDIFPEDMSDLADYAAERTHYDFFSNRFDFCRLGYEDYRMLYRKQLSEAHLLPESYRNLSDEDLHLRYRKELEQSRINPLFTVYGFSLCGSGEIIGQLAVEPSELTDLAYNIYYYIVPEKRGLGIAEEAVRTYLERLHGRLGNMPLLAIISEDNLPSLALAKACGFRSLPVGSKILPQSFKGFQTLVRYDAVNTER